MIQRPGETEERPSSTLPASNGAFSRIGRVSGQQFGGVIAYFRN
ncbi:hypothetical protein [Haladaptatus sp.]